MPKLRIYKKRLFFAGPSNIYILIDGKEVGNIQSEGKLETDVLFGKHTIQITSKYFDSKKSHFEMDVKKEIEVSIKYNLLFVINQILFSLSVFMSIFWSFKLFSSISLLVGLFFLLVLFFKRNDLFNIKELN